MYCAVKVFHSPFKLRRKAPPPFLVNSSTEESDGLCHPPFDAPLSRLSSLDPPAYPPHSSRWKEQVTTISDVQVFLTPPFPGPLAVVLYFPMKCGFPRKIFPWSLLG